MDSIYQHRSDNRRSTINTEMIINPPSYKWTISINSEERDKLPPYTRAFFLPRHLTAIGSRGKRVLLCTHTCCCQWTAVVVATLVTQLHDQRMTVRQKSFINVINGWRWDESVIIMISRWRRERNNSSSRSIDGGERNRSSSWLIDGGERNRSSSWLIDGGERNRSSSWSIDGGERNHSSSRSIDGGERNHSSSRSIDGGERNHSS